MLDVFMLTFGEPEADDNFEILKHFAPNAKRIDGVEGLLNAHKACAEESRTNYFYVCDADAVVLESHRPTKTSTRGRKFNISLKRSKEY